MKTNEKKKFQIVHQILLHLRDNVEIAYIERKSLKFPVGLKVKQIICFHSAIISMNLWSLYQIHPYPLYLYSIYCCDQSGMLMLCKLTWEPRSILIVFKEMCLLLLFYSSVTASYQDAQKDAGRLLRLASCIYGCNPASASLLCPGPFYWTRPNLLCVYEEFQGLPSFSWVFSPFSTRQRRMESFSVWFFCNHPCNSLCFRATSCHCVSGVLQKNHYLSFHTTVSAKIQSLAHFIPRNLGVT